MPTVRRYPVYDIKGLSVPEVNALRKAGIDNTSELYARVQKDGESAVAKAVGISRTKLHQAVNRADLMRVTSPALADVFEQVGVNSVKELARRRADALARAVAAFHEKHPDVRFRLPKPTDVQSLIDAAKKLQPGKPAGVSTPAQAKPVAEAAAHRHIDEVLFSSHADGASFRDAVLGWRPKTEWPKVQADMHAGVSAFLAEAEVFETPTAITFAGRLYDLYTEVTVEKASGKATRTYVEID